MLITFRIAAALACIVSLVWVAQYPKFDSWFALAVAVGTLASSFLPAVRARRGKMIQEAGPGSTAIQAGRDAHVSVNHPADTKDA